MSIKSLKGVGVFKENGMSANIIADQITWRSQGVGCIEMAKQDEAKHTINTYVELI